MGSANDQLTSLIKIAQTDSAQASSIIRSKNIRSGVVPVEETELYVELANLIRDESPEFACGAYIWHLIHYRMGKIPDRLATQSSADQAYELISANRSSGNLVYSGWSVTLAKCGFPNSPWWSTFLLEFFEYAKTVEFEDQIPMNEGKRGHWLVVIALNCNGQPALEQEATEAFIEWAESKLQKSSSKSDIGWHLQYLTESGASAACELKHKCGINKDFDHHRSLLADAADAIFWKYVESFHQDDCKSFLTAMFYGLSGGSIDLFKKSEAILIDSFDWISVQCFEEAEKLLGTLYTMSHTTYSYSGRQAAISKLYERWQDLLNSHDPAGVMRRKNRISKIQVRPW